MLLWFVLGYAFYSCLFAVAGCLVSRQEELQSTTAPLSVAILASFFGAFVVLGDPSSTTSRVISLLPPSAPLTMPIRVAAGAASPLEVAAALVITIAATVALAPLAARIYSGAVLQTSGSVKLRQLGAAPEPRTSTVERGTGS